MKLNLALRGLPKFKCLPEDKGQYGPTIHLLPEEKDVIASLERSFADVKAGRLPEFPTIEWYIHTTVDPTMKDEEGRPQQRALRAVGARTRSRAARRGRTRKTAT